VIIEATHMGTTSSRAHLIITFTLEYTEKHDEEYNVKSSTLSFIKLAGSERVQRTGVTGATLREACSIGKSLCAFGDVISAIASKSKFIPYRNSKLTYLQEQSLGGNCKTVIIGVISPASTQAIETLSTMRYLKRMRMAFNKPRVNINPQ
jgi:hypothetical protein